MLASLLMILPSCLILYLVLWCLWLVFPLSIGIFLFGSYVIYGMKSKRRNELISCFNDSGARLCRQTLQTCFWSVKTWDICNGKYENKATHDTWELPLQWPFASTIRFSELYINHSSYSFSLLREMQFWTRQLTLWTCFLILGVTASTQASC